MPSVAPGWQPGQTRRNAALRHAAGGPSWLPQRLPSRWSFGGPQGLTPIAAPLHSRPVAPACTPAGADPHHESHSITQRQQQGPSAGGAGAGTPGTAPGPTDRQWWGRAASCAVAAAVALSLLVSADYSAAAAASTATATAAATATATTTTLTKHAAPLQLLYRDVGGSGGEEVPSTGMQWRQQHVQLQLQPRSQSQLQPPALVVARGMVMQAQPTTQPGAAAAAATPTDATWLVGPAPAAPTGPSSTDSASSQHSPHSPVILLGATVDTKARQLGGARRGSAPQLEWGHGPGLAAVPGPGPGPGGSHALLQMASETEDRLLELARQVEARLERVVGALAGGVPGLLPGRGEAEAEAGAAQDASTSAAHVLIREVWEVVDDYYLDARSTGFDRQRWAQLRDAALSVPYRDTSAGYRAIRDMLARGLSDPYCRFIGPSELEAMKKYDVSGVGLNLGTAAEYVIKTGNELPPPRDPRVGEGVFVVGVSRGSAADVAGIRQGDELIAIQGQSLEGSTPFRAAGLISGAAAADTAAEEDGNADDSGGGGGGRQQQQRRRGPVAASDVVCVTVRHAAGGEEELSLLRPLRTLPSAVTASLTRSPPETPAAGAAAESGGASRREELVGTVRLASFNARAQADVAAAIRQLEGAGATRLVLDLRDNRGGLVTEGLEVARLFLEGDSPIVITERRDAPPDTPRAPGPALTSAPLLVLVNGHTASASEIVAGALRDNCRAVLAGSRTYGKGLIQSVYELSDGSGLVITVGKYLTPRGTDIDRYGIKPDFKSVPSGAQYDSTIKACKLSAPTLASGATLLPPPPSLFDDQTSAAAAASVAVASDGGSGGGGSSGGSEDGLFAARGEGLSGWTGGQWRR